MTDVVDKKTRGVMMSGIQGRDILPELMIRKALFRKGYRYNIHDVKLPGKPDLVLPKYGAVIFIHGCFWHLHDCHLFKWPTTRPEFWRAKITHNQAVDRRNYRLLKRAGWHIMTIWECALKGKKRKSLERIIASTEHWLLYERRSKTIKG